MIQRVQSIYLLMVVLLMAVLCFLPLFGFSDGSQQIGTFSTMGIEAMQTESPTWGVLTMAALSAIVALVNIFLFTKRKLQLKLCHITTFLILFFYVTAAVYFHSYISRIALELSAISFQPYIALVIPIIALIFNILAVGRIKKDEKLVRSLDRIR